eukprot:1155102-Pelagomonas_calceolata.AAC.3
MSQMCFVQAKHSLQRMLASAATHSHACHAPILLVSFIQQLPCNQAALCVCTHIGYGVYRTEQDCLSAPFEGDLQADVSSTVSIDPNSYSQPAVAGTGGADQPPCLPICDMLTYIQHISSLKGPTFCDVQPFLACTVFYCFWVPCRSASPLQGAGEQPIAILPWPMFFVCARCTSVHTLRADTHSV